MITEKFNTHKQCVECVKFIENECKGKAPAKSKQAKYFGTKQISSIQTGLHFCNRYEYDERLYVYPDKMPTFKSIKKESINLVFTETAIIASCTLLFIVIVNNNMPSI